MRTIIEDYLPLYAIGEESAREKSLWRGHPFTLHLWWARRPLVSCRAAIYGSLVPADRWVQEINLKNPPSDPLAADKMRNGAKKGLNRKAAGQFIEALCKYPGEVRFIEQARQHILEAHADRLTREISVGNGSGTMPQWMQDLRWPSSKIVVTREEIMEGQAPRPRVLDMFAGGGAIPLEALRLGCESFALDLNPVAHIIQTCLLVYPQQFGKANGTVRGMAGKTGADGLATWGGLSHEVRHWGAWVRDRVAAEIADLYSVPQVEGNECRQASDQTQNGLWGETNAQTRTDKGRLVPIGYLWTRTVRCKNPACGCQIPLVRQTWLCKKKGRFSALRIVAPKNSHSVRFDVTEANSEDAIDFDPTGFSSGGNATCPFCGTVADVEYVKCEGWRGAIGQQMMAVICTRDGRQGKVYLGLDDSDRWMPDIDGIEARISAISLELGLGVPSEPIAGLSADSRDNSLGITVRPYGIRTWGDLFTARQKLCLMTFALAVREAHAAMLAQEIDPERARAVATVLGMAVDREAENNSSLCRWNASAEKLQGTFGRQALPMVWDFCEINPFGGSVGDWNSLIDLQVNAIDGAASFSPLCATVRRGSALELPWPNEFFDAVITDPPYYDNVPYADISDFFYVWLKRTIGHLYPEHFATEGTPKKQEAIADSGRHGGKKKAATDAYEAMMARSFSEACRVLKPSGQMVVVYAHKTTLGWSTLVDALRKAGLEVTEAWPLDTEMRTRLRGMESAALATSIFIVARKRGGSTKLGNYEDDVQPDLEGLVRERVETLWEMGITGADLVIASVGAGLRAFTKYERVEYANGEEVPAEKFLAEVEAVVLDTMMGKVFGAAEGSRSSGVSAVDAASRFYVLWRYVYKAAEIEAGEAIVFTYGQHVELDGPNGLSSSKDALLEKKKGKYRLRDFTERGKDDSLGLPNDSGQPAPLVDVLHRMLWLIENRPTSLNEFLNSARPNRERLRVVAAALAGPGLSGKSEEDAQRVVATTASEQAALGKLLSNWKALVPESLFDAGKR